ncbi:MAG: hypothetical protein ACFFEE_06735 [Candidatus Thorarchaeota archaeon]
MKTGLKVRVFIESNAATIQAADMDTVGHPECTGTNTTDWVKGSLGKGGRVIPQEHSVMLDAASRAAAKLGLDLEIVDKSEYSYFQKRKMKEPIPRVEIGHEVFTGLPTSDEIVDAVQPLLES